MIKFKTYQAINQAVQLWQPLQAPNQQNPMGSYSSKQTEVMEFIEKHVGLSNPMAASMRGFPTNLRVPVYARNAMNPPNP